MCVCVCVCGGGGGGGGEERKGEGRWGRLGKRGRNGVGREVSYINPDNAGSGQEALFLVLLLHKCHQEGEDLGSHRGGAVQFVLRGETVPSPSQESVRPKPSPLSW